MKHIDLEYIATNYIEFEEVIREANISSEKLNELIENKLIPEASYSINSDITIRSSLNDSFKVTIERKYFHPSVLQLIKDNENLNPESFKMTFKENLLTNLKNHAYKTFAYGNVFEENGKLNEQKANIALEEEWNYFCQGIYGICTLNNNENDIIEKEIAIKRILDFIEKKSASLSNDEKIELEKLNAEFNKATSNFAPYQRELSSRGKYLDKLLRAFSLDNLIKKEY
ncbi:hypothetical protein IRZ83_07735 [Flavobacterium sp. JLP]|uniref:DUF6058 family natural product biosynthesis protein n=1 Tax=unclassified Flavobacterium TaxID=196869 RepID=UPI00188C24AF|nr:MULTISPECIES: DUF6058 family natural product biosynthesis protein [unclassified Flavobacterium]MBF4492165.1 hypothetical protein [Flavobacterium sp. MR2016-29]MBF4506558.1 hypothetical protein [Flavobacterium sp. JLP]